MPDWREGIERALTGAAARVERDVPLARLTTFRIGGPAEVLVRVSSRESLATVVRFCADERVGFRVLGRGSNVLVSDQGLGGITVVLDGPFGRVRVEGDRVRAGGGAALDAIAAAAEAAGLAGAEFLAGIPGTVGGGLETNAGAFGRSLSDILERVTVTGPDGAERDIGAGELATGYRRPVVAAGVVVVEAAVRLVPGKPETCEAVRQRRLSKQPQEPSAGSFFRNPDAGPAGRLIDRCGLKGRCVGGAQVSPKHANFLVNTGGACCADVLELAQVVKATVEERTGVLLVEEVKILPGADDRWTAGHAAGGPAVPS